MFSRHAYKAVLCYYLPLKFNIIQALCFYSAINVTFLCTIIMTTESFNEAFSFEKKSHLDFGFF